jgi:hypothetical protein
LAKFGAVEGDSVNVAVCVFKTPVATANTGFRKELPQKPGSGKPTNFFLCIPTGRGDRSASPPEFSASHFSRKFPDLRPGKNLFIMPSPFLGTPIALHDKKVTSALFLRWRWRQVLCYSHLLRLFWTLSEARDQAGSIMWASDCRGTRGSE